MNVVITGGLGFLGQKLVAALLQAEHVQNAQAQNQVITRILVTDIAGDASALPVDPRIEVRLGDVGDADFAASLIDTSVTSVYHLASLVSGGAEKDFAAGLSANMMGTLNILEACRLKGKCPRLVFTSSVAAYGGELPAVIADSQRLTPQSSYGSHKAAGELLVADYSRKGFIDGRSVRLPIITVRPGKANTAASSWASAIVREPLAGIDYACPVAPQDRGFVLSPTQAIRGLMLAHDTPALGWGDDRAVMMAGLSCTAQQFAEALLRQGGEQAARHLTWKPDPFIRDIINSWPNTFDTSKAQALGFAPDASVDAIVLEYISNCC